MGRSGKQLVESLADLDYTPSPSPHTLQIQAQGPRGPPPTLGANGQQSPL